MFIDEARQLLESRAQALGELMGAWEVVRLDFLLGRDNGVRMNEARAARRIADGDAALFLQVQEAVLEEGLEAALDQRLQALFMELAPHQGVGELRARQDELLTALEAQRLEYRPMVAGRVIPCVDLETLSVQLPLPEERQAARLALDAAARHTAPLAAQWWSLEHEAAQAQGHASPLEAQAAQLGLSAEQAELWLRALPTPTGTPATESGAREATMLPVLETLRDTCELLGLEIEGMVVRWKERPAQVPSGFLGLIEGAEGSWPIAMVDLRPGLDNLRAALTLVGQGLGLQAEAVRLRQVEEPSSAFPLRALQALAGGLVLAALPGHPEWSARMLEGQDSVAFARRWRQREWAGAALDLCRVAWLGQAFHQPLEDWDHLWRSQLLSWGLNATDAGWATDPVLSQNPRQVLTRVAARCLAASWLEQWGLGLWPALGVELGGQVLDEATDPPAADWAEAMDSLRDRLDPASLERRLRALEEGLA